MSKKDQIDFTYKEVAEALIRYKGLKKGKWGVGLHFGTQSMNVGPNKDSLTPAAVLGVMNLYLHPMKENTNLTADAAVANKAPAKKKLSKKKTAA